MEDEDCWYCWGCQKPMNNEDDGYRDENKVGYCSEECKNEE